LDNEIDRKIDVTAILFLLVQNRHQTHDWTLIGSDANGLGIQKCGICHFFGDSGAFSNRKLWKSIEKNEFFTIYSLLYILKYIRTLVHTVVKINFFASHDPKLQKLAFIKIQFLLNLENPRIYFLNLRFLFLFYNVYKEKKCSQWRRQSIHICSWKTTIPFIFVRGRRQSLHICSWKTTIPLYLFLGDDNSFIFGRGRRQSLHICLWKTTIPIHLFMEDENSYIFGRGRRQSLHMYWC